MIQTNSNGQVGGTQVAMGKVKVEGVMYKLIFERPKNTANTAFLDKDELTTKSFNYIDKC